MKEIPITIKPNNKNVVFTSYDTTDIVPISAYISCDLIKKIDDDFPCGKRKRYIVLNEILIKALEVIERDPNVIREDIRNTNQLGFMGKCKNQFTKLKFFLHQDTTDNYKRIFGDKYVSIYLNKLLSIGYEEFTRKRSNEI